MSYAKIAFKFKISKGTISKYRQKYGWHRNDERTVFHESKLSIKKRTDDKHKRFCRIYLNCYNATKAYQKVYHCSIKSARANGSRLLNNDKIQSCLHKLFKYQEKPLLIDANDVLNKYIELMHADISDYVKITTTAVPVMKNGHHLLDVHGKPVIHYENHFKITDFDKADWSLVKYIHIGKHSFTIRMYDKTEIARRLLQFLPKQTYNKPKIDPMVTALKSAINKRS